MPMLNVIHVGQTISGSKHRLLGPRELGLRFELAGAFCVSLLPTSPRKSAADQIHAARDGPENVCGTAAKSSD